MGALPSGTTSPWGSLCGAPSAGGERGPRGPVAPPPWCVGFGRKGEGRGGPGDRALERDPKAARPGCGYLLGELSTNIFLPSVAIHLLLGPPRSKPSSGRVHVGLSKQPALHLSPVNKHSFLPERLRAGLSGLECEAFGLSTGCFHSPRYLGAGNNRAFSSRLGHKRALCRGGRCRGGARKIPPRLGGPAIVCPDGTGTGAAASWAGWVWGGRRGVGLYGVGMLNLGEFCERLVLEVDRRNQRVRFGGKNGDLTAGTGWFLGTGTAGVPLGWSGCASRSSPGGCFGGWHPIAARKCLASAGRADVISRRWGYGAAAARLVCQRAPRSDPAAGHGRARSGTGTPWGAGEDAAGLGASPAAPPPRPREVLAAVRSGLAPRVLPKGLCHLPSASGTPQQEEDERGLRLGSFLCAWGKRWHPVPPPGLYLRLPSTHAAPAEQPGKICEPNTSGLCFKASICVGSQVCSACAFH